MGRVSEKPPHGHGFGIKYAALLEHCMVTASHIFFFVTYLYSQPFLTFRSVRKYLRELPRHHFLHKTLRESFGQRPKENVENACVCACRMWLARMMGGSTGEMLASFIAGAKNWRRAPFYMTDMKLLIGPQINATLHSPKREDAPFLGVGCAWTSRSLGLYFSCAWGKDRADHVGNFNSR